MLKALFSGFILWILLASIFGAVLGDEISVGFEDERVKAGEEPCVNGPDMPEKCKFLMNKKIVDAPTKKCPKGQKLDRNGKCKMAYY